MAAPPKKASLLVFALLDKAKNYHRGHREHREKAHRLSLKDFQGQIKLTVISLSYWSFLCVLCDLCGELLFRSLLLLKRLDEIFIAHHCQHPPF